MCRNNHEIKYHEFTALKTVWYKVHLAYLGFSIHKATWVETAFHSFPTYHQSLTPLTTTTNKWPAWLQTSHGQNIQNCVLWGTPFPRIIVVAQEERWPQERFVPVKHCSIEVEACVMKNAQHLDAAMQANGMTWGSNSSRWLTYQSTQLNIYN